MNILITILNCGFGVIAPFAGLLTIIGIMVFLIPMLYSMKRNNYEVIYDLLMSQKKFYRCGNEIYTGSYKEYDLSVKDIYCFDTDEGEFQFMNSQTCYNIITKEDGFMNIYNWFWYVKFKRFFDNIKNQNLDNYYDWGVNAQENKTLLLPPALKQLQTPKLPVQNIGNLDILKLTP